MYTKQELENIKKRNKEGFEYEGKHYTLYEGTQLQRKIELESRKQKDIQIIAKASGDMELVHDTQKKLSDLAKEYKELSEVSGLRTKIERLQVEGYKRERVNLYEYYKEKLQDIEIDGVQIRDISKHFIETSRIERKINIEMVKDTLQNPLKIDRIRIDDKGQKSFQVIGRKTSIVVNPDTRKDSNRVDNRKGYFRKVRNR